MKILNFLILILLFGCTSQANKVYICGDHPCKDKKEINEYFNNNISVEVYVVESKKQIMENIDLVDLNLNNDEFKKKPNKNDLLFLKKKDKDQNVINWGKKYSKIETKVPKKKLDQKKIKKEAIKDDQNIVLKPKKRFNFNSSKATEVVHLCKNLNECDINIISKRINDLAKEKSFPNINY